MATKFYETGKEFQDYYPVEKCGKGSRDNFKCPKCGHLEMRVKLIERSRDWFFTHFTIECEKCGTRSKHRA